MGFRVAERVALSAAVTAAGGGAGLAGVVEAGAAAFGLPAGDQAELVPSFDGEGVDAELVGQLVQGEHAGVA